jgi:hypothetical protein
VNNVAGYWNNDLFEPRFQRLWVPPDQFNGLWNPRGTMAFRLLDVTVPSIVGTDGRLTEDRAVDAVVGTRLTQDNLRVTAKVVDLDVYRQNVSEIYGLRIRMLYPDGKEALRGDFAVTALTDLWMRYRTQQESDPTAAYHSVLTEVKWGDLTRSPFLRDLRERTAENLLSVKFNLDGVATDPYVPETHTIGRIVGSIGAYEPEEPRHFLAARRLRPQPGSKLTAAPCKVDDRSRSVYVDLGNSVPTTRTGGPLIDLGPLRLAVLPPTGPPVILAPLDIPEGFYEKRAGIAVVQLTPEQLATVADNRLAIVDAANPPVPLLAESSDGTYVRAEQFVFRIYPDPDRGTEAATTTLHATKFGKPAVGAELFIGADDAPDTLQFPRRLTTDAKGRAVLRFTGTDPGNERGPIDGDAMAGPYGFVARPKETEGQLTVRLFSYYDEPENPNWVSHVQPIFQRYSNLYPGMRDAMDLANYNDVVEHKNVIRMTLMSPLESPLHMPVTRDLSPGKRDMIVKWLDTKPVPPILDIDSPEVLRKVLQQALLLEQATIPPYLCAQFSLKSGTNVEIADIIGSVVREEMLHMVLVANLLNAVGGTPVIGRPGVVPTYPGRLPAPVLPDLNVRLRKFSIEQVRDVFMAIEQPQHPIVDGRPFTGAVIDRKSVDVDRTGRLRSADTDALTKLEDWYNKAEYEPMTIGWFYNQIARAISRLDRQLAKSGKTLFTGDPKRQVSWADAPGTLYRITDRRSALLAIYEIIEQGEGTPHDLDDDGAADAGDLGHYYQFKEIVEGRRLVRNAAGKWVYKGALIPFAPDGVYPMIDDPDTYKLPGDSPGRRESTLCDQMYTKVLSRLNLVVNGEPETLPDAVALMYELQIQAKKLFDVPSAPGAATVIGPAFQSPGAVF